MWGELIFVIGSNVVVFLKTENILILFFTFIFNTFILFILSKHYKYQQVIKEALIEIETNFINKFTGKELIKWPKNKQSNWLYFFIIIFFIINIIFIGISLIKYFKDVFC